MARIKLEIELNLDYDLNSLHPEELESFKEVLINNEEFLILHSNYLGDSLGNVKVLKIYD